LPEKNTELQKAKAHEPSVMSHIVLQAATPHRKPNFGCQEDLCQTLFDRINDTLWLVDTFMFGKNSQQRTKLQPPVVKRYAMPSQHQAILTEQIKTTQPTDSKRPLLTNQFYQITKSPSDK